jgi:predicted nucleic acid-binding Zn ribbon protein
VDFVAEVDHSAYNKATLFWRQAAIMLDSKRHGPRPLGEILGALFATRGFGRLRSVSELEAAWITAVGQDIAAKTRVGAVRHGVVNVTVSHPTLLEELSAFRKHELVASLKRNAPSTPVRDIRFRVGYVHPSVPPELPVSDRPETDNQDSKQSDKT